ncbi:NAD-dependent epimerase/dehydratase family protein [Streptomonospora sp. S1-112]|uniref:NAD-dependent epimerase/dehydratase family protein n=1 Tax=Streptomonospora mangrovi TaxID=2883123 RepID=A0A9X3NLY0_9ACTN|nr:NAD-dependent epimerase/dehydratase family protein [Streptomonospora mangrovi]MDA0565718.1 NAD-dependent epimerase/dehydratase family protein [Streptomonospora mangrovi]
MPLHVIVGAGPVGTALAHLLADSGEEVRVLTRSGGGPERAGVTRVRADASDAAVLTEHARGAAALYNCANPGPYTRWARDWPPLAAALLRAAEDTGAVLAVAGNLYGYGPVDGPMTPDLPLAATDRKGRLRARMWREALARHEAGAVRATEVRASDYVGAVAPMNSLPLLFAAPAVRGRPAVVLGDPDVPHTVTYVPDVARTLAAAASDERAWGRAWHVPSPPARTLRQTAADLAHEAGARPPRVVRVPRPLVRLAFPVAPLLREVGDLLYQWDRPYVLDAAETTEVLGIEATPWDEVVRATVRALGAGTGATAGKTTRPA